MSWANIRGALKTAIDAVSGTENVYEFRRHSNKGFNDDSFRDLFAVTDGSQERLEGWFIEHKGMSQAQCEDADSTVKRTHRVEVFGFRSLVDADSTANTWSALVEAIFNALNATPRTLSDNCLTYSLPQVDIDTSIFYDHLCHTARVTMEIEENV